MGSIIQVTVTAEFEDCLRIGNQSGWKQSLDILAISGPGFFGGRENVMHDVNFHVTCHYGVSI